MRIEKLIEINWKSWVLLIGVIAAFLPLALSRGGKGLLMGEAVYFFLAVGWALLLLEWLLLRWSESVIDWLIVKGHQHRRAAELHHETALRAEQVKRPSRRNRRVTAEQEKRRSRRNRRVTAV